MQAFTDKSMDFQTKIIERSGLGDETYLPEGKPSEMLLPTPNLGLQDESLCRRLKLSSILSSCSEAAVLMPGKARNVSHSSLDASLSALGLDAELRVQESLSTLARAWVICSARVIFVLLLQLCTQSRRPSP